MLHGWPIGACLRCRPIGATAASRHQCRMVTLGLVPVRFREVDQGAGAVGVYLQQGALNPLTFQKRF